MTGRIAIEVNVRSLVDWPANVVELQISNEECKGARRHAGLLSPREARQLAKMLFEAADQADDLPVREIRQ